MCWSVFILLSDVSLLELKVGTVVIDAAQMHNLTADLSSLLGGTFHNTYDFLKPISLDRYTLARIFPRERLNGESIGKWIDSFPSFQVVAKCILIHSNGFTEFEPKLNERINSLVTLVFDSTSINRSYDDRR